ARLALPERRVLRWGEEARRDPADGDAPTEDRRSRRDRLRARHRRAEGRRGGGSAARRAPHGRGPGDAPPADPQLHQARLRPCLRRRPDRRGRRPGARREARGFGLRTVGREGSASLMAQTETEIVQGIGSDYEVKYGFNVPEDYFFKSGRG